MNGHCERDPATANFTIPQARRWTFACVALLETHYPCITRPGSRAGCGWGRQGWGVAGRRQVAQQCARLHASAPAAQLRAACQSDGSETQPGGRPRPGLACAPGASGRHALLVSISVNPNRQARCSTSGLCPEMGSSLSSGTSWSALQQVHLCRGHHLQDMKDHE